MLTVESGLGELESGRHGGPIYSIVCAIPLLLAPYVGRDVTNGSANSGVVLSSREFDFMALCSRDLLSLAGWGVHSWDLELEAAISRVNRRESPQGPQSLRGSSDWVSGVVAGLVGLTYSQPVLLEVESPRSGHVCQPA